MNYVPKFKAGQHVRVMQTDQMVMEGIHNKTGVVVGGRPGVVLVEIATEVHEIGPEHLMHHLVKK